MKLFSSIERNINRFRQNRSIHFSQSGEIDVCDHVYPLKKRYKNDQMIKIGNSKFTLQMEKYSLCVHKLKMRMCEFHLSLIFASESSEHTQKHVRISLSRRLLAMFSCNQVGVFFFSAWNLVALTRSVSISPKITQKKTN